jgi:hypothetical protein
MASGKRVGKGAVLLGKTGVNRDLEGGKLILAVLQKNLESI